MADPVSVSSLLSGSYDLWRFVAWLRDIAEASVISAQFKWDGTRVYGSVQIEVTLIRAEASKPDVWFYFVSPLDDYSFLRYPVVQGGIYELITREAGASNPDARYWRWVAEPMRGLLQRTDHVPPNAQVDFVVIGYRPSALIKYAAGAA